MSDRSDRSDNIVQISGHSENTATLDVVLAEPLLTEKEFRVWRARYLSSVPLDSHDTYYPCVATVTRIRGPQGDLVSIRLVWGAHVTETTNLRHPWDVATFLCLPEIEIVFTRDRDEEARQMREIERQLRAAQSQPLTVARPAGKLN